MQNDYRYKWNELFQFIYTTTPILNALNVLNALHCCTNSLFCQKKICIGYLQADMYLFSNIFIHKSSLSESVFLGVQTRDFHME